MDKMNREHWEKELEDFLKADGITDQKFYDFVRKKVTRLPLQVEDFGWGVFPITDKNGVLTDIRMVVPIIYDEKSLCVNIHEYTHAYEVYTYLGSIYEWHIEESEEKAKSAEKRYLNKKQ